MHFCRSVSSSCAVFRFDLGSNS